MSPEQSEIFSRMALTLHHEKVPEATVHLIVGYARSAIRCDEVGVTVTRRNKIETAACTSMIVRTADQFQQSLREGPGVDVGDGTPYVLIDDTLTDEHWPRWTERLALLGLRSILSVQLQTVDRTYGALNFYGKVAGSFSTNDLAVATTFARHASIALASSEEVFNLKIAVDSRTLLGQAQGILMERFKIDADRAFDVLRRYSQARNVKLSVIAQQVVDEQHLPETQAQPMVHDDVPAEARRVPPPMTLASRDDGPYRIISVEGEIDVFTAREFIETALTAVEAGHCDVIVDMNSTSFIDSSGLSAFILVKKAISKRGGTLDVVGAGERVHRLFSMAGLDQVIAMHSTLDQAKGSHQRR